VNITSGTLAGARGLAAYAASKGAVASLTYSWAKGDNPTTDTDDRPIVPDRPERRS
jgi:NAD(P)-dependent dehydrogenase (short-subunit alcohol dehydrogenase family)